MEMRKYQSMETFPLRTVGGNREDGSGEGDQKGRLLLFFKMRKTKAKIYLKIYQNTEERADNSTWMSGERFPQGDGFELDFEQRVKFFQRKKALHAKGRL